MLKNDLSFNKISHYILMFFFILIFFFSRYEVGSFSEGIIGDGNDSLLNLTLIENNIRNIRGILNGAPWETLYKSTAHYPYVETTLFTEPIYVQTLFYSFNKFITDDQSLSYNLLFLWAFLLNFFSFHFLAKVMKLNDFYSILLSVLYASSHLIAIQYVHLQNQFIFSFPLIAGFSILAIKKPKLKYFFSIAFTINLQFFACAYYGLYSLYFSLFFPAVIMIFHSDYQIKSEKNRFIELVKNRTNHKFLLASIFSVIPIAIVYMPFKYITRNLSFERIVEENAYFSNTISSIFTFPKSIASYHESLFFEGVAHNSLFMGMTIYAIVVFIILLSFRKFKVNFLFLILAIVFFVFSLGPMIEIFSMKIGGPYKLLYKFFPGFNSLRVPNRISVISVFFIFMFLVDFLGKNSKSNLLYNKISYSILSLVFFWEYGYLTNIKKLSPLPNQTIATANRLESYPVTDEIKKVVLFMDFKRSRFIYKTGPVPEYISLMNGFITMNGYSGHTFPFQNYIETAIQDENVYEELFQFLANLGLTHIIILDYDATMYNYLKENKNFFKSSILHHESFVEIELNNRKISENDLFPKGKKIDFTVIGSSNKSKEKFLKDSNKKTYWEGLKFGYQSNEDFLDISLGSVTENFKIYMENGPFVNRFAYGIDIYCNRKKVGGYSIPQFSESKFLNDPYGNQFLTMNVKNCNSNRIEMRINKKSKYSYWTVSQLDVYSAD